MEIDNRILGFRGLNNEDMRILEKWYGMTQYFGYATGFKDFAEIKYRLMQPFRGMARLASMITLGTEERTVGFVFGEVKRIDRQTVFWIHILIIDPEFQNKGIGTWAVNWLMDQANRQYGPLTCIVAVSGKNRQGLAFWEKNGFIHFSGLEESLAQTGTSDVAILKKSIELR